MKAHRALDGVRYAFTVQSDLHVAPPARKFARRVAAFDAEAVSRAALHAAGEADAPLISAICRETPLRALTWKEAYLRGLELCAGKMGFREDAIYDPEALTKRMLGFARVGEAVERMDERGVRMAARMGARELISYLYRALAAQNEMSSHASSSSIVFSMHGSPMWESTAVSPWPGKCLPQQSMPPFL